MNTKKAKALRKSLGYHPTQKRTYAGMTTKKWLRGKTLNESMSMYTCILHVDDLRAKYQKLKRQLNADKA